MDKQDYSYKTTNRQSAKTHATLSQKMPSVRHKTASFAVWRDFLPIDDPECHPVCLGLYSTLKGQALLRAFTLHSNKFYRTVSFAHSIVFTLFELDKASKPNLFKVILWLSFVLYSEIAILQSILLNIFEAYIRSVSIVTWSQ